MTESLFILEALLRFMCSSLSRCENNEGNCLCSVIQSHLGNALQLDDHIALSNESFLAVPDVRSGLWSSEGNTSSTV